jgi:thiol-disulfide isomerase/thioredoxin
MSFIINNIIIIEKKIFSKYIMKKSIVKSVGSKSSTIYSNPLFIIITLIVILIVILAIFRNASPFLSIGFGINGHIGELKGSLELEAFENNLSEQQSKLFVIYYAEWCGHCKRTMPEFNKLKENYNGNIKIIAINSEDIEHKELIKSQNILGYPTIRYYPSGLTDTYTDYSGNRTYEDFLEYVNSL